jgi:putative peptidoglycan lipid II flippase
MFPFLLLIALAAVAMGVLNTKGRFAVPSSASMMFNVGTIAGGLLFAYWLSGGGWTSPRDPGAVPDSAAQWAITGMAIGTLVGGGLQFLVQLPSLLGVGFRFRPVLSFTDPGVRQVMRLMGPAVVGTAAVQVNVLVNTYFAASIDGGPSWLGYAFRLMQFPIGLFGIAVGTAVYPTITRYAVEDNLQGFRSMLSSSLGLVFLLTVPSACGLFVLARPISALIYERGAFTASDTRMVSAALAAYAVGLAGYAAIKVLLPAFYALGDARTPMITSLLSVVVNAALGSVLLDWLSGYGVTPETPRGYAHAGPALATSCVVLLNFAVLSLLMRRRLGRLEGRRILSSFARIAVAAAALSLASHFSYRALLALLGEGSLAARLAVTAGSIAVGVAVFFAAARLLSVRELSMAVGAITERLRKGIKE